MAKYFDRRSAKSRAKRCRYRPGEKPATRHARRKGIAEADYISFITWCDGMGIDLKVKNEGHHWIITFGGKIIEWWPSSAKCVVDKKWQEGIHLHDTEQLKQLLRKEKNDNNS